jgi:DNA-binding YbaB/EbfC family protein
MKGPLGQLMRQAQQVQDNLKRAQDEVAKLEVTGESGAGMVRVTLDGKHQARRVEIAPAAMQEDKEFLEDLIAAAINDASQKLDVVSKEKMAAATGGM